MSNNINDLYEFADFRFDAGQPSLWKNGELVSVPPKALKILVLLIEKQGEIVSREELLEKVWHETFVEESNINYTISLLRKALGENNFVQTVSKRGYRFVAEVKKVSVETNQESGTESMVETPPKFKSRWILASIILVGLIALTSFAFLRRSSEPINTVPNPSEALKSYTRGKMILEDIDSPKSIEKGIDEFQKAITHDPTFALGYVGLAEGFAAQGRRLPSNNKGAEYYAKAKTAAQKALTLEPDLAEAYSVLGWIKLISDWDWDGAENDIKRSIQLKPNDAIAHYRFSQLLITVGNKDEALNEIKRALEIDPISETALVGYFIILQNREDFEESLTYAENFLDENKDNQAAKRAVVTALYYKGDFAKVIEMGEEYIASTPNQKIIPWLSLLASAYHKTENFEKADEMLQKLETFSQTNTKALHAIAANYAELGRNDEAFNALEKCLEQREERMIWIKTEPRLANLRSDGRFQEILKKMKLG